MGYLEELAGYTLAGKYQLDTLIGQGGFSAVYRAQHLAMERTVAIKLLHSQGAQYGAEETWTQRFSREARMISQLEHPNTITVFDYGTEEEMLYLVMEHINGPSLKQLLRKKGALEPKRAVRLALGILGALEEAHHYGILHRDLKPSNIMVTRDFKGTELPKILDFGIAKWISDTQSEFDPELTQENSFVGTPRYAAPEQIFGQKVTPATDVYGVGMLVWDMLVGAPAMPSASWHACMKIHLVQEAWELPRDTGIPIDLARIVERAVLRKPRARYASCTQMRQELESWLSSAASSANPRRSTAKLTPINAPDDKDDVTVARGFPGKSIELDFDSSPDDMETSISDPTKLGMRSTTIGSPLAVFGADDQDERTIARGRPEATSDYDIADLLDDEEDKQKNVNWRGGATLDAHMAQMSGIDVELDHEDDSLQAAMYEDEAGSLQEDSLVFVRVNDIIDPNLLRNADLELEGEMGSLKDQFLRDAGFELEDDLLAPTIPLRQPARKKQPTPNTVPLGLQHNTPTAFEDENLDLIDHIIPEPTRAPSTNPPTTPQNADKASSQVPETEGSSTQIRLEELRAKKKAEAQESQRKMMMIAGGVAVVAILLGLGVILSSFGKTDSNQENNTVEEQLENNTNNNSVASKQDPKKKEKTDETTKRTEKGASPFTFNGILLTIRSNKWRVMRIAPKTELSSFTQQTILFRKGNAEIEVILMESLSEDMRKGFVEQTKFPARSVEFDTKIVRIIPRNTSARHIIGELETRLKSYKLLVKEEKRK